MGINGQTLQSVQNWSILMARQEEEDSKSSLKWTIKLEIIIGLNYLMQMVSGRQPSGQPTTDDVLVRWHFDALSSN